MNLRLPPLFGPVYRSELLTMGRRVRYTVLRTLYAVVLLVIIWQRWPPSHSLRIEQAQGVLSRVAQSIFVSFSVAQLYLVVAITPAIVGAAVSRDRELRRLEDLLATPMGRWSIVADKFLARLTLIGAQVLAGVPVLALAMLMGGISPAALVAEFVFTLSVLLAVGGASMLVSVWAPRARDALIRAYLYLVVLVVLPPFGAELAYDLADDRPGSSAWLVKMGDRLDAISEHLPYRRLTRILQDAGESGAMTQTLLYSMAYAGVGLACVGLAMLQLGAAYRKSIAIVDRRQRGKLRWRYWRPPVGDRGVLWKEIHVERDSSLGWRGRGIAIAIMVVAAGSVAWTYFGFNDVRDVYSIDDMTLAGRAATSAWLVGLTATVVVGMRAASCITRERERDSWHLLMSTPIEPAEVLHAKAAGSWFEGGMLFALIPLLWAPAVFVFPYMFFWMAAYVMALAAICAAAVEFGLILSLVCRNTSRAVAAFATLFLVAPTLVDLVIFRGPYSPRFSPPQFLTLAARLGTQSRTRMETIAQFWFYTLIYVGIAVGLRFLSVWLFDAIECRKSNRVSEGPNPKKTSAATRTAP